MSLEDVVAGLEEALGEALDVRVYASDLSNPVPPCVVVGFPEMVDLEAAFGGYATYTMPVTVVLPITSMREARTLGDQLVGQISDAITVDPSLRGRAHSAAPVDISRYQLSPVREGGPVVLSFTMRVAVLA